jgi:hypothetical protein
VSQHGGHSRQGFRLGGVDRQDAGMRSAGAQDAADEHARLPRVGEIGEPAVNLVGDVRAPVPSRRIGRARDHALARRGACADGPVPGKGFVRGSPGRKGFEPAKPGDEGVGRRQTPVAGAAQAIVRSVDLGQERGVEARPVDGVPWPAREECLATGQTLRAHRAAADREAGRADDAAIEGEQAGHADDARAEGRPQAHLAQGRGRSRWLRRERDGEDEASGVGGPPEPVGERHPLPARRRQDVEGRVEGEEGGQAAARPSRHVAAQARQAAHRRGGDGPHRPAQEGRAPRHGRVRLNRRERGRRADAEIAARRLDAAQLRQTREVHEETGTLRARRPVELERGGTGGEPGLAAVPRQGVERLGGIARPHDAQGRPAHARTVPADRPPAACPACRGRASGARLIRAPRCRSEAPSP